MFCKYCGTKNEQSATFCTGCGRPLNGSQNRQNSYQNEQRNYQSHQESYQESKPKSSNPILILGIAIMLLGILGGGVALIFPKMLNNKEEARTELRGASKETQTSQLLESETTQAPSTTAYVPILEHESTTKSTEISKETQKEEYELEQKKQQESIQKQRELEEEQKQSESMKKEMQQELATTTREETKKSTSSERSPFYGIWCHAAKRESNAQKEANALRKKGLDAQVFLTTDWSNLNSVPWYVVSAGTYSSKAEAKAALSKVQSIYSDAYVKYSGDWQGDY